MTVYLAGEIDMATAPAVEATMGEIDLPSEGTLVIDLADVTFLDSRGVQMLLRALALAERAGAAVVVRSPQPMVARVLDICGIARMVTINHSAWPPPDRN